MAMQAEYPSDVLVLPETSWNRMGNLNGEQRNFIPPADINVDDPAPDFKMLPFAAPDGISNRLLQSYPFQGSMHGMATCWPSYVSMPELNANMLMCNNNNKKRLRESDQPVNFVCLEGLKANSLNMPLKSSVSTGLRLSFEEDLSNSTTRREFNNNSTFFVSNNLAAEIQRQRDEMEQFMRLQEERMRQSLIEKTEKHSKVLLCAAAAAASRKLQEKDLQLVHMKQKNMELEERIKGLEVESLAWQNRAKCSEAVATALKLQIEERNKEGSGDSEEEAANAMTNISSSSSCQIIHSTNNNNNSIAKNIYKKNRELEMQWKCRVCRSKEACILLLPCRHLCVCEHCDNKLDVCPLCSSLKTASVQVYIT